MSAYSFYPGSPSFLAMKYQRTYTPRTQLEPGERYRLRRNMEIQVRNYFPITFQIRFEFYIFLPIFLPCCAYRLRPFKFLTASGRTMVWQKDICYEISSRLHLFSFSKKTFERSKSKEFSQKNPHFIVPSHTARNINGLSFRNAPMYPNII